MVNPEPRPTLTGTPNVVGVPNNHDYGEDDIRVLTWTPNLQQSCTHTWGMLSKDVRTCLGRTATCWPTLSVLGAALVLTAVACDIFGPRKESEPNDTFAQAEAISFGEEILGKVTPVGNADYYRVVVTKTGSLYASGRPCQHIKMGMTIQDSSGNLLHPGYKTGYGEFAFADLESVPRGTYYVGTGDRSGKRSCSEHWYTLKVELW